ncbi:hypothetical protein ABIB40_001834 [Pedobacter sp. UYP30]|uniref:hypothetical protein n=1 Tax=Pedobacter sp. UYP30 TaxID=1756400 RepID=UPI0033958C68
MKVICVLIFVCLAKLSFAQFQTQKHVLVTPKSTGNYRNVIDGMDVIKIPFPQAPLLHDDGGWEKGPSNWVMSKKFPVEYTGGLLLLDRNGMVHYLIAEVKFSEPGSIEISANSMGNSFIGLHPFKRVFGKKGEKVEMSIITKEKDFGNEINLYLKDFKPSHTQQVN